MEERSSSHDDLLVAARMYLRDALLLKEANGSPAGIVSQCWLAVSECAKVLLALKGSPTVYDRRKQGLLLMRTHPDEVEVWTAYGQLRSLHRETYETSRVITDRGAEIALRDAERVIARTAAILGSVGRR